MNVGCRPGINTKGGRGGSPGVFIFDLWPGVDAGQGRVTGRRWWGASPGYGYGRERRGRLRLTKPVWGAAVAMAPGQGAVVWVRGGGGPYGAGLAVGGARGKE